MKATQILIEEHEAIKRMLSILEKIVDELESSGKANIEHLENIQEFITVFADRCHHAKEENVLFPAMTDEGFPQEEGPLKVMLSQHEQGRSFVKGFGEALAKYQAGDISTIPTIVENARGYIALLRDHIDKENNILYPIADMHLSQDKDETLIKKFEQIETERIGEGKHEEFHRLLENLSKIYLSRQNSL
jgi:hemerythrin-like domain-containing protein